MGTEPSAVVEVAAWAYQLAAPAITALLGWLSIRAAAFIRHRIKREREAEMLARLTGSVIDAVVAVNQQSAQLLRRAREPGSPGGTKLTSAEVQRLREEAVSYIKAYWGPKGLRELADILGFEGRELSEPKTRMALDRVFESQVEAAVAREKERNPIDYENANSHSLQ